MDGAEARREADELLEQMAQDTFWIERKQAEAEAEMAAVRARYEGDLALLKAALDRKEKELAKLMRAEKKVLFDGIDKVKLAHGILLYARELKVKIPRDALERIEEQGWVEAVNVVKTVNRAVVEQWPEERLVVIGAQRKPKESFSYELSDCGK